MKRHLRIAPLLAAAAILFVLGLGSPAAAQDFTLTILHNNDAESQLINLGSGLEDFGGAARFKAVVDALRADAAGDSDASVLLSSGDNFLAGPELNASIDNGVPFFDSQLVEALGYDALAIGNHEFDLGPDFLADFIGGIADGVPFLSANLDVSGEPGLSALEGAGRIAKSTTVVAGGQNIGIVGATTPNLPFISSPRNVVVNPDVLGAVQAEIDALEGAGVNKIIVISHLQGIDEDLELISQLRGIDVAIAGGGDELLANPGDLLVPGDEGEEFGPYPVIATDADGNDVPVVTTTGQLAYVGRLKVTFDGDGVLTSIDASSGPVRVSGADPDAVEGDADVQANIVDPVSAFVAGLADNIIGVSEVELDGVRNNVRSRETNEGNLIADALLWQASDLADDFGVDPPHVALQNGGGIRNDNVLPPGDISELTTFDILPFGNFLTIIPDIPAEQFKEIMENAVSAIGSGSGTGRFAQVAGFRFTYNPDGMPQELDGDGNVVTPGNRILDVRLNDGTAIVAGGAVVPGAPSVNIATGDFLARGGDQYPYRGAPFTALGVTDQQTLRNFIAGPLGGLITAADYPVGGEGRIQVRSLQGTLDDLFAAVAALIESGDLNRGQGNALTKKLEGIARKIEEGQTETAINRIGAFVNQVEAFGRTGRISEADADNLLELASVLVALLRASDDASEGEEAEGGNLEASQQVVLANESTDLQVGLEQNYPNPFAESTEIGFSLNKPSQVGLTVYDLLGREVMQLVDGDRAAGAYRVTIDASGLPSGMYVYQLEAGGRVETKLMSIVK